jgi:hypothetical protein
MNTLNALTFGILGLVMEIVPLLFPSWFPRNSADQASARALWLGLMGAVQVALAAGFIVRSHVLPVFARLASSVPAGRQSSLPLPVARGVSGR